MAKIISFSAGMNWKLNYGVVLPYFRVFVKFIVLLIMQFRLILTCLTNLYMYFYGSLALKPHFHKLNQAARIFPG